MISWPWRGSPGEVFRLQGRAVTGDGKPVAGVGIAVVDQDALRDDLLGVGRTAVDGSFRISFCRSEFNQDIGEREALPDIQIILSARIEGAERAFFRRSFPGLSFPYGMEDLGPVVVDTWRKRLDPLPGVEARPGHGKDVRRLRLDDELVRHCLEEVAPLVESITGWPHLLSGVRFRISSLAGLAEDATLEDAGLRWLRQRACGYIAAYNPLEHVIYIDRARTERLNLDGMKVVMGHELVHVGQCRLHPEVAARRAAKPRAEADVADQLVQWEDTWVEGYAYYLERDFIQAHYNLATFFQHAPLLDAAVLETAGAWLPPDSGGEELSSMFRRYRRAITHYRARQSGSSAAPFVLPRKRVARMGKR